MKNEIAPTVTEVKYGEPLPSSQNPILAWRDGHSIGYEAGLRVASKMPKRTQESDISAAEVALKEIATWTCIMTPDGPCQGANPCPPCIARKALEEISLKRKGEIET